MHESQAHWQQDQPSKSVLGCHLSLKGTSQSLTSGSCAAPPSHMPRVWERNEEHLHTEKQICGFRSQQSSGSQKPQEIKIRTLWAIHVFLRGDQYCFLSVGCFTYSVEKVLPTQERPLQHDCH